MKNYGLTNKEKDCLRDFLYKIIFQLDNCLGKYSDA